MQRILLKNEVKIVVVGRIIENFSNSDVGHIPTEICCNVEIFDKKFAASKLHHNTTKKWSKECLYNIEGFVPDTDFL